MNFLFFDIECSNCINGEGKICSFGYVLTDDSFTVLKKKDLIINPDSKFTLTNKAGEGIHLAYPEYRFKSAKTFPHFYQEIKKLLEDKDTLAFGFAVHQDVSYLLYSCSRYQLPLFNFSFFDIQKLEKEVHKSEHENSLDKLVLEYNLHSYTLHKSDDDALMTMEVFKEICDEFSIDAKEVFNNYKNYVKTTTDIIHLIEVRKKNKRIREEAHKLADEFYTESKITTDINLVSHLCYGKSFFFDYQLLAELGYKSLIYKEKILRQGGRVEKNPTIADYLVIKNRNQKLKKVKVQGKYLSLDEFDEKIREK